LTVITFTMMISNLFDSANAILACPMCMSGADDNTAIAANAAIGVLFVILMGVLACFLGFIGYIAKRSKLAEEVTVAPIVKN